MSVDNAIYIIVLEFPHTSALDMCRNVGCA